jgi:hypothetical protein
MFPAVKVAVHASNLRGVFLILMYDVFIKLVGPENFSLPEGSKGLQRAQEMSTNPQTAHPLRCTHNLESK